MIKQLLSFLFGEKEPKNEVKKETVKPVEGQNKCRLCDYWFENIWDGHLCSFDVKIKNELRYRRCETKNPNNECKDFFKRRTIGDQKC